MEMDHEYIAIIPEIFEDDKPLTISVDKVGGGTLGLRYDGTWNVKIFHGAKVFYDVLTTGTPKRHDQVAAIAGQFFADSIDEVDDMETYDRLIVWAGDVLHENDYS